MFWFSAFNIVSVLTKLCISANNCANSVLCLVCIALIWLLIFSSFSKFRYVLILDEAGYPQITNSSLLASSPIVISSIIT